MTNPTITIHNVETGEIIEREMTTAEKKTFDADVIAYADKEAAKVQAAADRAQLLAKLGITADEAKLLLGGN